MIRTCCKQSNSLVMRLIVGDGRQGYTKGGTYDVIHVGAYIQEIPIPLIDQLKNNGKLFIPSGKHPHVNIVTKDSKGKVEINPKIQVSYVPLTSKELQLNN